jgi:hypothetical protein
MIFLLSGIDGLKRTVSGKGVHLLGRYFKENYITPYAA